MKIGNARIEEVTLIRQKERLAGEIEFVNLGNEPFDISKMWITPNSQYAYHREGCVIYGNRTVVDNSGAWLDCPIEWDAGQIADYISRVRSTHRNEFNFFEWRDEKNLEIELLERRPYASLPGPAVFCGSVEAWNFGFFVAVVMQKIHVAASHRPGVPIVVPVTKKWQHELLQMFYPGERFVYYDPECALAFERLDIIGWPNFGFSLDSTYVQFLRGKVAHTPKISAYTKIYLSRGRFMGGAKRIVSSSAEESRINAKGFVSIYPETLSYQDMIQVLSGCEEIVLESGSALYNCAFLSSPDTRVTLIENRQEFVTHHSRLLSSVTRRPRVILAPGEVSFEDIIEIL